MDLSHGIKIKKYIEPDNSSNVIVMKEYITKDSYSLDTFKADFEDMLEDGIVGNCSFEDVRWNIPTEFNRLRSITFPFELNKPINDILKCYAIVKLYHQNTSFDNTYKSISFIHKCILDSNFFNVDNIISFRDSISTWSNSDKQNIYYLQEFLKFANLTNGKEYLKILEKVSVPPTNTRVVPNYQSIINLDFIIKDFIKTSSIEERLKYYPFLLWWEITSIIPTRPIEFMILKKDCIYEQDNHYFIKIERRKKKGGRVSTSNIRPLGEIEITKELYEFIDIYKNLTMDDNKSKYLLSYNTHDRVFNKASGYSSKKNDMMTLANIRNLLKDFYSNIIDARYGYTIIEKDSVNMELNDTDIETIQLGDSRHIAFCSMMLQGFNPLTIARIGGHNSLSEQTSYCSHMDSYIKSYTYIMAKSLRNKLNINFSANDLKINNKEKKLSKAILGNKFYTLRKVPGGRCNSDNFPFECDVDDHIYCPHFIADDTLKEINIKAKEEALNKDINVKVKYLIGLSRQLVKYGDNISENNIIQENLKATTNNLNTLINRKAILESYSMKLKEV